MRDLRIGSVPYVNALPLTRGLSGVVRAVPSRLAGRFRAGEVDVALVPSFEALRLPDCPIVPGLSISSPGPVDSVLLLSRGALREVRRVLLDPSSLTSVALTRILLRERFRVDPEYAAGTAAVDPRAVGDDAVLLIGDPALRAPRDGLIVTDLALEWRRWTGRPFTFAVWLARDRATADAAEPLLRESRERGRREIHAIAEEAACRVSLSRAEMLVYLTERITYDLGPSECEALARFESLCRRCALLPPGAPRSW